MVLGSSAFVSDFVVNLSRNVSDVHLANFQLIQNLTDWALEDVELLKIRSRGMYARTLEPTSIGMRKALEWGNYGLAIAAVVALGMASLGRRRKAVPFPLPNIDTEEGAPTVTKADEMVRKEGVA